MRAEAAASKEWADQFIGQMKAICGRYLVATAPPEEDAERNTDLIVLRMGDETRIACRVRTYEQYRKRYGDEFTIRCSRPSGARTELAKIRDGWGDYLLYGFGRDNPPFSPRFVSWTLARLDVFREVLEARPDLGRRKANGDGSSEFRVFRWDQFPPEFVVATNRTEQQQIA